MSFKQIRIALLLIILVLVVHHQFNDKARVASWANPLFISIYPVNAEGDELSQRYIERLDERDFEEIERFIEREGARYGLGLDRPVYVQLGNAIKESPPAPPVGGNFLQRASWIARMRWWRWRFDNQGMDPDVIVLARYFEPTGNRRLPHSTGVEQIRIAIANLFASKSMRGENLVVLAHEILHTIGATDKYDLSSGLPIYPGGFAEPERTPLFPQRIAEIMAGRIPVDESRARQAQSLQQVIVGPETAAEIGWKVATAPALE
ncbi:MAG: hypothetical protein CMP07_06765 [Xanthomonadales bacterium]|nr:hypothetical protein [Xanthomonadales bacterium]